MKINNFIAIAFSTFATVSSSFAQGSLTPPGAPGPSMVTLSQIEPRTIISSLPFVISSPGSYCLASNLTGSSGNSGLVINANNVTVDLRGFALTGVAGSLIGIYVNGPCTNVSVENGNVTGWGGVGIHADSATGGRFHLLGLSGNGGNGLEAGTAATVDSCTSVSNNGIGIATENSSTVRSCTAAFNSGYGIYVNSGCVVDQCSANNNNQSNIESSQNCTISRCAVSDSGTGSGISAYFGGVIVDSTSTGNAQYGIEVVQRGQLLHSTATFNNLSGIHLALLCTARGCTSLNNGGSGILCDSGYNQIVDNNCSFNGLTSFSGAPTNTHSAGIYLTSASGSRVEGNTLIGDYCPINVNTNGRAFIGHNTAENCSTGYQLAPGNSWGPIVNVGGVGDISATANANHPQANFIH